MQGSILGHPVKRVEDPRFLTGQARYTEDLISEGALQAVFLRSFMPHARIGVIDASEALAMPGVEGVYAASDLNLPPQSTDGVPEVFSRPLLAEGVARFVGEPVAVLVADTRTHAIDAAELVSIDYEPLPAVTDVLEAAGTGAPLLFPEHGSNIAIEEHDPPVSFAAADVVVSARFKNQRLAAVPLEGTAALAEPDPDTGGVKLWLTCQAPHWSAKEVARCLGLKRDQVHVIAPSVGGGFGAKIATYPEQIVIAALALRLGAPVRFVETRSENMTAMTQGRAQMQDVKIGATRDGTITALQVFVSADQGAYPGEGKELSELTKKMASGVYKIPSIEFGRVCVATNTTPIFAYRGAGRPEAAALIERIMDMLAAELNMDPIELRRRNFIPKDAFPYRTPTDATYDVGDYELALERALEIAGYEEIRKEQARRRADNEAMELGIGIACYVELTGFGADTGTVEIHGDGRATVTSGISPHGQGHETAQAQIVSATLGIPIDAITVTHSDTRIIRRGDGTMGSRSLQVGGSAVLGASEKVLDKARRITSHVLEVDEADVMVQEGGLGIAGAPESTISWGELATLAMEPDRLPADIEPGLAVDNRFRYEDDVMTFPFGCHVAIVEVDTETGRAELLRHVAVDDCGRVLNPMLVQGQQHGGIAQGVAQALFEEIVYDPDGNPLSANLASYGLPTAAELPSFETYNPETPTPLNPLGAKGIGESATIGSTPAVQNAVVDALGNLGIHHVDMPLVPHRVWKAIKEARSGG
ncbi:MAG: xanthine dehydrogenase family protein molybdopterin-binding subunit [Actinobacteria bacterium]|nr:xanthine dehydrogenase family protein molybdopterin-binding subunit [Actinomycetota bacterium]